MKDSLLFICHDYHRLTKSINFILELINKKYEVEICFYSLVEENGSWLSSLKNKHYSVVLCWQVMPSIDLLKNSCTFDFGVFFPMADYYYWGGKDVSAPIWKQYQDFQIISFSKKMHENLIANGFSSHYFQYFPEPVKNVNFGDPNAVFFWQRVTHINIYTVLTLLKNYNVRHLHIHRALDPGESYIPCPYEYQQDMKICYSSWFEKKEDMLDCMDHAAVYVAARYSEGIGMSFLEAMARGRCVIAPDETTFNEYIKNGETGFLFIPSAPQPIECTEIQKIQKNAYNYICSGYQEWLKQREKIPQLFTQKPEKNLSKIRKLEKVWNRNKRCEGNAGLQKQQHAAENIFVTRVRKFLDIIRGKTEIYHKIEEKKICGIHYFTKMERYDKKKILIFFFGLPLFSAEFIEED